MDKDEKIPPRVDKITL